MVVPKHVQKDIIPLIKEFKFTKAWKDSISKIIYVNFTQRAIICETTFDHFGVEFP